MAYVRDDVQNLLTMLASVPGPQMHEVDAPTARAMYLQMGAVAERPQVHDKVAIGSGGVDGPVVLFETGGIARPGGVEQRVQRTDVGVL